MRPTTLFASFVLAAAAVAGPALAADDVPAVSSEPVPAGTYTVDKIHTSLIFRVSHLGFSTYTGRFTRVQIARLPERPHVTLTTVLSSPSSRIAGLSSLMGRPYRAAVAESVRGLRSVRDA